MFLMYATKRVTSRNNKARVVNKPGMPPSPPLLLSENRVLSAYEQYGRRVPVRKKMVPKKTEAL